MVQTRSGYHLSSNLSQAHCSRCTGMDSSPRSDRLNWIPKTDPEGAKAYISASCMCRIFGLGSHTAWSGHLPYRNCLYHRRHQSCQLSTRWCSVQRSSAGQTLRRSSPSWSNTAQNSPSASAGQSPDFPSLSAMESPCPLPAWNLMA